MREAPFHRHEVKVEPEGARAEKLDPLRAAPARIERRGGDDRYAPAGRDLVVGQRAPALLFQHRDDVGAHGTRLIVDPDDVVLVLDPDGCRLTLVRASPG